MTSRFPLVRDRAPLLLTHTQWVEKEALAYMAAVSRANFAGLDDAQKMHYVALHRQALAAFQAVEDENTRLKDTFKSTHLALLERELKKLTGADIDPERARIYTRYREFKEGRSPLDVLTDAVSGEPEPESRRTPRAVDESRYVDHIRSVSLWEAACTNFSYRTDSVVGQPYSYEEASHINYGEPSGEYPVKPFIEIVRRLDIGSALSATLAQALEPDGLLYRLIAQASTLGFEFELLEAFRTSAVSGVTQAGHAQLLDAFNGVTSCTVWPMSLSRASGEQLLLDITQALNPFLVLSPGRLRVSGITLPLFFIQLPGDSGVYSYFPQRRGGALRLHASRAAAEHDFKQQLKHDHHAHQLGWFASQWSLQEFGYLQELLSDELRPKGLNWLAGKLYDGFHQAFPKHSLDNLGLYAVPAGSRQPLAFLLGARQAARYREDLRMLATAKSEVDWQAFKDAVLAIGNEVLGMLTTPMPGGVLGLTKVMQVAIFGSLTHSFVQGAIEAYKGEGSTFASALADTADLLISVRLTGVAAKAHRQRMSTFWRHAGHPRKVIHPNGKIELRQLDPHINPGQLALEDSQGLSDAGLLQRMLPVDTPASTLKSLERMLRISATSREQLQAVWQGQPIPAPLAEGARRLQVDLLIDQIIRDVPQRGELPVNADSAVLALLTQLGHWPADTVLDVFNQQGQRVETYGKDLGALKRIEVKRLDHGGYVAKGDVTQGSARAEALFILIVEQLPEASRLGREDNEGLSQTGRIASIREQIADLAQNDRALLFKALTALDGYTRNDPVARVDPANKFLPLACPPISDSTTLFLGKLHQLHPSLSIESLEFLIGAHPFRPNEITQLFDHSTQPATFARAVEQLKIKLRVDSALDGIYHSRAYHVDSDHWARECAGGVLRDTLDRRLVVSEMFGPSPTKPYVPNGPDDTTVELRHYGRGRYEAYDFGSGQTIPVAQTGDSLYRSIGSVLQPHELAKLGMHSATDVAEIRKTLGDAMLSRRQSSGEVNLWDTTLAPYQRDILLPADQPSSELGLYEIEGEHYLALDGPIYRVEFDASISKWRMQHPDKVGVNTPVLEHNYHGAWRQESENPLQWTGLKLLRRLRAQSRRISDEQGHKIMTVSHTDEGVLRQVHMNNLPPPPLLIDTWKRFQIEDDIQVFVTKLQSHATLSEARSDLQLLLIQNVQGWPIDKVLQVVDEHGTVLQEYGYDLSSHLSRIVVTRDETYNGSFLRTLLSRMNEVDTRALLDEYNPDLEARVLTLAKKIADHAFKHKAQVFKVLYRRSERSQDPHVALVQRNYPELPNSVIQNLLRHTTEQENTRFLDQNLIPPRLAEQSQWEARKVRLTRAYEGLYLGTAATTPDSERLTLRMLYALSGWPANVRIEVRRDEVSGQVLDIIGSQEGMSLRTLVKSGDQYRAYSPEGKALNPESERDNNLLSSILYVLDDSERAAIGVEGVSDTQVLAAKISEQAIKHRANIEALLGLEPTALARKPPMNVERSFVAYPLMIDYRGATHSFEQVKQAQMLYPSFNLRAIFTFLESLGGTSEARQVKLVQLRMEFETLKSQLASWASNDLYLTGGNHISMALPGARHRVCEWIKRAWRKETEVVYALDGSAIGYALKLYGIHSGNLPALTGDFSHIRSLHLDNMGLYSSSNEFLSSFTQLQVLTLSGNRLNSFPAAIAGMSQLTTLNLAINRIVLTAESAQQLAGLSALQYLYLMGNPLGITPDVSRMTDLRFLELSHTRIETWPVTVLALPHIDRVNLRDNRITHIPQAVFEVPHPGTVNRRTRVHGNPLSDESRQRLMAYWARTRIHMGFTPIIAHEHAVAVAEHQLGNITPWLSRALSNQERRLRKEQWRLMQGFEGRADSFFKMLAELIQQPELITDKKKHALQNRVWALIDHMLANTELRDELLAMPYDTTCMDGAMVQFEDREVQVLIHRALEGVADDAHREVQLFKLARGLFRLKHLDKKAEQLEFDQYDRYLRREMLEPDLYEIQLYLRIKLAGALELPTVARDMHFENIARVSDVEVAKVQSDLLELENTPEYNNALLLQKFWREFLLSKYADRFKSIKDAYLKALDNLAIDKDEGTITEMQYYQKGTELGVINEQKINGLIRQLTERAQQVVNGAESTAL